MLAYRIFRWNLVYYKLKFLKSYRYVGEKAQLKLKFVVIYHDFKFLGYVLNLWAYVK